MLPFSERFAEAKGAPVYHNGKEVVRVIKFSQSVHISISILSTNISRLQAIVVTPSPDFSGTIYVNCEKVKLNKTKRFPRTVIWLNEPNNRIIQFDLNITSGSVAICNGAQQFIGDIPICSYSLMGCAMIQEADSTTPYKYIVRCNDYENNEDFNDLVFEMTVAYE